MYIGKKIKLLRTMRGLTQEELAKKINKTRALVSYSEQTGKINHYTLQAILKALGVSEEEFEGFKGKIGMVQEESGAVFNTVTRNSRF